MFIEAEIHTKWPRVGDFSFSTQLSMKFILLLNVNMPKIIGILAFISWINIIAKTICIFQCMHCSFYEHLEFHAQVS